MNKRDKAVTVLLSAACAMTLCYAVSGPITAARPISRQTGSGPLYEAYKQRMARADALATQATVAWKKEKNLPKAEALFKQALSVDSDHGFCTYYLAQVLDEEGKTEEAQKAYEKVVYPKDGSGSTMQQNPAVWSRYAQLTAEVGKRRESDEAFQQAIALLPTDGVHPVPKGAVTLHAASSKTSYTDHKKAVDFLWSVCR